VSTNYCCEAVGIWGFRGVEKVATVIPSSPFGSISISVNGSYDVVISQVPSKPAVPVFRSMVATELNCSPSSFWPTKVRVIVC
jgi:hypothetical protein